MMAEQILNQIFPGMTQMEAEAPRDYMEIIGSEVLNKRTANGDSVEEALMASNAAARIGGFHIGLYTALKLMAEAICDIEGVACDE